MPVLPIISHNYFCPFLSLCLFPEVLCVSVHYFQAVLPLMERLVLAGPAVGETHTGIESELEPQGKRHPHRYRCLFYRC